VVNSFIGRSSKKEFTAKDRKIALFGLIATHVQFVVGLILYFKSPLGSDSIGQMAESDVRLTWLEHPIINILAIVLITIGWSKHKKATTSKAKFNCIFLFYGLGLLLILSRIPWKLWF
jgi:NADH:ubiquinone oxidoreductase subunit 2 (subunit N)